MVIPNLLTSQMYGLFIILLFCLNAHLHCVSVFFDWKSLHQKGYFNFQYYQGTLKLSRFSILFKDRADGFLGDLNCVK